MLIPLLTMASGFTLYFFAVLLVRMRALMLARRIRALTIAGLQRPAAAASEQPAEG
jgi:heme exporter protein C